MNYINILKLTNNSTQFHKLVPKCGIIFTVGDLLK